VEPLDQHRLDLLWGGPRPELRGAEGLSELFGVWCRNVPYSTTLKWLHHRDAPDATLWGLDPGELVDAALRTGLGATCFGLAAGFCAAALGAGYDASVHVAGSSQLVEHAVCVVDIDGTAHLCDPAFVHLRAAQIPARPGSRTYVGPPWAPLVVERGAHGVDFVVARGLSSDTRRYTLGEAVAAARFAELYETVGRWDSGMVTYLRMLRGDTQVTLDAQRAVIKQRGGLRTVELGVDRLDAQLAELTGLGDDAVELLAAQIRAETRRDGG
jgi:hypothetical protein